MIEAIFDLFARLGARHYGEDVSLRDHMLQSAAAAEAMGGSDALIVAALLHDVGHFLDPEGETAVGEGRDLGHETLGAAWLSRGFAPAITVPIALHVLAKRYLCAVEPDNAAKLSTASRLSLAVQGGAMTTEEASAFSQAAQSGAAVFLRRCDDRGKDCAVTTRSLEDYRGLLTAAMRPG